MSLLDQFGESFIVMDRTRASDGEGGFVTAYTEGITINAALRYDSTMEARRAEHDGVTSVYTILASKSVSLEYHDVLKRVRDGQVFRVTSNAGDSFTPPSSSLDLTAVTAEKWSLA